MSNQQKMNVLGPRTHTTYADCFLFLISVGSDSDLNESEKDLYQKSVQENEIDICEEILKDVDNITHEFLDVPDSWFPDFSAGTSYFDFDSNPIN